MGGLSRVDAPRASSPRAAPEQPAAIAETKALVQRARDGDAQAWLVLYRNAYPGLLAYARRRLYDHADAVEAVDETMARAVAGIGAFRWQRSGFNGWLYGILRNVVYNVQRRQGRTVAAELTETAATDPEPVEGVIRDEDAAMVRAAFSRLSPTDRELLELRVVAGLSAEETGAVLGRRAGAVRTAQSRALARLRSLLDDAIQPGP